MTVVTIASVKGAPGVTTLAGLLGAAWPGPRPAVVVESDAGGGDIAARFRLSTRVGWSSFITATRRAGPGLPLAPHLQQLPSGLPVLVGSDVPDEAPSEEGIAALVASAGTGHEAPVDTTDGCVEAWDLLVDLGRVAPGDARLSAWSRHATWLVVVLGSDPASAWAVRRRAPGFRAEWGQRMGLAVVAGGAYTAAEIASFTGLPLVGQIPSDLTTAGNAAAGPAGGRRRQRSPLVRSAAEMARRLAAAAGESGNDRPPQDLTVPTGRLQRSVTGPGSPARPDRPVDGTAPPPSSPPCLPPLGSRASQLLP